MKSFGWTNVTKVRKAGFSLTECEFPAFPAEVVFLGIQLWDLMVLPLKGQTISSTTLRSSSMFTHKPNSLKMMVIKWELQKIKRFYVFQAKTASAPTAA